MQRWICRSLIAGLIVVVVGAFGVNWGSMPLSLSDYSQQGGVVEAGTEKDPPEDPPDEGERCEGCW